MSLANTCRYFRYLKSGFKGVGLHYKHFGNTLLYFSITCSCFYRKFCCFRPPVAEVGLIIYDIVFAEIAPFFRNLEDLHSRLEALGVEYDAITPVSAFAAGEIFKAYRKEGGPRVHLIPDFLVGAHALYQAGCLAARDRGYLRRYFPQLRICTPEQP
jgi:predicted nucleic acid-binding protein